jgi:hypothetical protein
MALALASVAVFFFVYAKITAPNANVVNGIYYNECCGDVILRDGKLLYKSTFYKYDLENMKFGLTAFVPGKFTEQGIESSPDETAFLFDSKDGKRGFKTIVRGREYSFLKTR